MDWGGRSIGAADTAGPTNKWIYARRIAAALGYIALGSGDRLTVALLGEQDATHGQAKESRPPRFGPARGKGQTLPLLRFLAQQRASGGTDLNRSLRAYAQVGHGPSRPGLAILISDLFSPGGYQEGLSTLLARGYEGLLIQVLAPEEANPHMAGDLELVDIESGREQEVTIDAGMRRLYRRRLAAWQAQVRQWCTQRGVAYAPVVTDVPFDALILFHLRQRGWVR
jgi:uncharacterized protein (DUF58 family)